MSSTRKEGVILPGKGKLILTMEMQKQIDWLHDEAPKNKEWCGILFYRHMEGDISDPASLVLQAEGLYLMDLGSEAYTDADIDIDSVIEMDDLFSRELKKGLIHTHHNMTTFFSGTDMDELHINTPFHNYYLSLIVNYSGEYTARVAYIATKTTTIDYKNVKDEAQSATSSKEILAQIEMDIEWEVPEVALPDYFPERFEKLKQEKAAKVHTYTPSYQAGRIAPWTGASQVSENVRSGYNWDAPINSSRKQAEIPFVTSGGNLKVGSKELRPYGVVSKELTEKVSEWLANGITTFTKGTTTDTSIREMVKFLDEYFDFGDNEADYPFFVNQMQRSMEDFFLGYFPGLVETIGGDLMDIENNDVATDLYMMFGAWQQYLDNMEQLRHTLPQPPQPKEKEVKIVPKHKVNKRAKK